MVLQQKQSASAESKETIYKEQQRPIKTREGRDMPVSRSYQSYNISSSFRALVNILPDSRIFVGFDFNQFGVEKVASMNDMPPTTKTGGGPGIVSLGGGRPRIAGATKEEKKGFFFIFCADIKS